MEQGLDERTVTKAYATLDATIRELTMACKTRQEKRVAVAKTKVLEIRESVTRKIDEVSRYPEASDPFSG